MTRSKTIENLADSAQILTQFVLGIVTCFVHKFIFNLKSFSVKTQAA